MTALVFCVLRSGGEFDANDVAALQNGLLRTTPDAALNCLSDVTTPVLFTHSLKFNWPGWWSKMELFRPDIEGDIFYVDLDTVIVGDLSEMIQYGVDTMLDDFYYPVRPASGLMYITQKSKAAVWNAWLSNPDKIMQQCGTGGDQLFLSRLDFGKNARRWQQDFPHQVISFKAHMRPKPPRHGPQLATPPKSARVVCFHGKPRPRNINEPWINEARRAG